MLCNNGIKLLNHWPVVLLQTNIQKTLNTTVSTHPTSTQHYCILISSTTTAPHTAPLHPHTLHTASSHTAPLHSYTQHNCILTHNTTASSHTAPLHPHTLHTASSHTAPLQPFLFLSGCYGSGTKWKEIVGEEDGEAQGGSSNTGVHVWGKCEKH